MLKKSLLALAFVAALGFGGLGLSSSAEAGGCGYYGGHHHHGGYPAYRSGPRYSAYYGYGGPVRRSYGYPAYYGPRSGLSFYFGF